MLLQFQRKGDWGSPRVLGSTRPLRSDNTVGSVCVSGLRPPPTRRLRPGGTEGTAASEVVGASSRSPWVIVARDIPVAVATVVMPPRPSDAASAAAQCRRSRSLIRGRSASNLLRMQRTVSVSGIPPVHHTRTLCSTCSCAAP